MTTTFTQVQGARSSTILSMGTLADGTYKAAAYDQGATIPLDKTIEVVVVVTSPVAPFNVAVYAKLSLDGTNYGSGPESGTDATDDIDLMLLGVVPCKSTGTHRAFFSLADLPVARYGKIVTRNNTGVALTSGEVYWSDITGNGA